MMQSFSKSSPQPNQSSPQNNAAERTANAERLKGKS